MIEYNQSFKISFYKPSCFIKIYIFIFMFCECLCFLDPNEKSFFEPINGKAFQEDVHSSREIERHSISYPSDSGDHSNGYLSFLDEMLRDYDKRAWPTYGTNEPTLVSVNMHINSLGSINAANMEFSLDIYLRQSWIDPRLKLTQVNKTVTLNGQDLLDHIWKPDLFFRNLKSGSFHTVTVPNKLIKLSPEGRILFSMRLTLRLSCHMTFRHYPLDTQRCWVILGSYAQTIDQVKINWQELDPITIEDDLELAEFYMAQQAPGEFLRQIDTGAFSFLNVSFILMRQNGYHLVQTYLPTLLIVMISWVSFWLHVDATPARVTLGVTTLLTLTTVSSGVRTQLPPVSYVKAIDIWIGACSVMVFGALLEFTLVNYLSRRKVKRHDKSKPINLFGKYKNTLGFNEEFHVKEVNTVDIEENSNSREAEKKASLKKAQRVDRICRILFPIVFLIFNTAYWSYYLYMT